MSGVKKSGTSGGMADLAGRVPEVTVFPKLETERPPEGNAPADRIWSPTVAPASNPTKDDAG